MAGQVGSGVAGRVEVRWRAGCGVGGAGCGVGLGREGGGKHGVRRKTNSHAKPARPGPGAIRVIATGQALLSRRLKKAG